VTSARATFLHYLGQRKLQIAIGIGCAAATAIAAVVPPRFIGEIIDALQRGTTFDVVVVLALASVAFSAAEAVFRGAARYLLLDASRQAEYRMRNDLFAHLQEMHLAYFQHQRIGTSWPG
jgi:ABC-type multidrug transport system fused ATPase/permease subunit